MLVCTSGFVLGACGRISANLIYFLKKIVRPNTLSVNWDLSGCPRQNEYKMLYSVLTLYHIFMCMFFVSMYYISKPFVSDSVYRQTR